MQGHIHQSALPVFYGRGNSLDWLFDKLAAINQTHCAATLGHKHAPVWQERHAPRMVEPFDDGHRTHGVMLGLEYAFGWQIGRALCEHCGHKHAGGDRACVFSK